ncbi:MAG TPA: sigma-E factor regulatory protein RseB domain-containing protein [Actinomycetes bacterium]|nr:sigma-E factor regulatory protein RseB domain-containing protein [Actinomycetes bacterium]
MRRLAPAVGATVAVLLVGSLALFVLLVGPPGEPARDDADRPDRTRPRPDVDPAARALLRAASAGPAAWAYEGTQMASAWEPGAASRVATFEVAHDPRDVTTTWWDPRRPDRVHTAVPSRPSLLGTGAVGLLVRHYSVRSDGSEDVAGRPTAVVAAYRPGTAADDVVARFWLDEESGVVLRREVYAPSGRATRQSVFLDIDLWEADGDGESGGDGDSGDADSVPSPAATDDGRPWPTAMDAAAVARMSSYGWNCPRHLPGPLQLVDARRGGKDSPIVHLSYADGIASISVFQQHGRLDPASVAGYRRTEVDGDQVWVRDSVPRRIVWSSGGQVYTVVADAPQRTVDRAVVLLHERADQGEGGPVDRLGRGLDRVASWFNPFE